MLMKTSYAGTDQYQITLDTDKNRIYITIRGFWAKASDIPDYVEDVRQAAAQLAQGFTCLADMTTMKTPSPEAGALLEDASKVLVAAGVSKNAGVFSQDAIAHMAAERRADAAQMDRKAFASATDAEAWLDQ
jgi:type II secretory pathway component GspD/PulD (secretin)